MFVSCDQMQGLGRTTGSQQAFLQAMTPELLFFDSFGDPPSFFQPLGAMTQIS